VEGNKNKITKRFLFIYIVNILLVVLMTLKLKCDICGVPLNAKNIGLVIHPEDGGKPIMRCKECHNKIKSKKRQKNSSYMLIED